MLDVQFNTPHDMEVSTMDGSQEGYDEQRSLVQTTTVIAPSTISSCFHCFPRARMLHKY